MSNFIECNTRSLTITTVREESDLTIINEIINLDFCEKISIYKYNHNETDILRVKKYKGYPAIKFHLANHTAIWVFENEHERELDYNSIIQMSK